MLVHTRPDSLLVWAPAKLNLFLEVLGKRSDGYHEIETLMVTVSLYDRLSLKEDPSGGISLQCDADQGSAQRLRGDGPRLPAGADNLVFKAAELLRSRTGTSQGVLIRLAKQIPLAAGLGGGSSDAAATLVGLNRLWGLGLSKERLSGLAAELGSDVPFFLDAPAAVCRGRGEHVTPIELPLTPHFVVACPASGLSTADVYHACEAAAAPRSSSELLEALKRGNLTGPGKQLLFNRLQRVAEQLCPAVERLRRLFSGLPTRGHQMSGSGTAYFALFPTRREAMRRAGWLRSQCVGRVFVVRGSS